MTRMKKTIWYISKYASPVRYGFGTRHFFLGKEFAKLGHTAVVIASDSNHLARIPVPESRYRHEVIDDVDTWWIRTIKYKGASSFRRILSWLDFEWKLLRMDKKELPRPDVIIASSLSLFTILSAYWLKKKYGCKLIFEIRDIWPLTIIEEGGFSPWNPFVKVLAWVERFGYMRSDVIVGTMPNLSEHVEGVTGRKRNCQCVPFGYDPALYSNMAALPDGYEEAYIPKVKFLVGYAGTIGRTNALDTLIECAFEMKDNPHVHFLLVGDGDLLEQYKARTASLPNITFAPKVKKEQVQSVLRYCDILYFAVEDSKVWRYGLSLNKLIDYMMAGKPIIASYNGYPSMLNEAQCGVFVPAKDVAALVAAFQKYAALSKDQLAIVGQRGKDWLVEHRPYAEVAREYCELFGDTHTRRDLVPALPDAA